MRAPVTSSACRNWGRAKIIVMTNTLAHLPDLHEAIDAVRYALVDDGVFVVQVPWARDMLLNNQYDTIYHEHQHWFTVAALDALMSVVRVDYLPALHGGSLRVFMTKKSSVHRGTFRYFSTLEDQTSSIDLIYQRHNHIITLLDKLHKKTVDAFGASAKGVMLLNQFPHHIDHVYDDTPTKIGKRVPGTDLHIFAGTEASKSTAEVMLITAWNYADEIAERLHREGYRGKFLVPFPVPRFL